jgi:amino acid transporter/nucleotide-binding universal stress UspA family protein
VNTQPVATSGRTKVVVATTVMLSFISFWRAAAIVLNDLGSSAYYVGGIAEQAIGKSAPWFIFAIMLFSYAVRAVYVESCSMFTRGGVYRVVKEAMGGTLAKLSVSALMFDYILTGPISGVSAGQYITGLIAQLLTYWHHPWKPSAEVINLWAAGFALVITVYFWWRNTKGIHESSDDALRIMYITTVMVVMLIGWCLLTIAIKPGAQRLPPAPFPHNLAFNKDAVGWLPKIAPHALRPVAPEADGEGRFGLVQHASGLLGLIGILIAFGHSFLAMSGEESLAQVNRELEHPKHKNLMRAGLVIFVYSLLFTSLVSFFAYAIIPDDVRPHYFDNLISGISIYLVGPDSAKLIFQAFIVIVGFLMLAGAINTSIIGANGVLNRVSEDGVMPDWFRAPHRRFGTTYRMINLIVILQIISIVGSRGDTYALGEAYAFGVIWSFAFKGLAMLVLRFKDRTPREWKVPFNIHIGHTELPLGLAVIAVLLFAVAGINLITKQVATVTGIAFTIVFFVIFEASEKIMERKRTEAHVEMDAFQLQPQNSVTSQSVGVRPGNILCLVRDYHTLDHLQRALEFTDTVNRDLVVMTAQVSRGADAGYKDIDQNELFTNYEQLLFSRVVSLAERAGKRVSLLVVPSNDLEQAVTRTAVNLNSTEIIAGPSATVSADDQARRLGHAWEQLADQTRQQIRYRIIREDGSIKEFLLGAHAPNLEDQDVNLIHNLWLDVTQETHCDQIHHRDVVALALSRLDQDLHGIERGGVLAQMRCLTSTAPTSAIEPAAEQTHRFVVGVFGTTADLHAADFAAQLGQTVGAQIHLIYPYLVPRNMPLAPVTGVDQEEIEAGLRRLEGVVRARELDVVRRIEPARSAARCLVQTAAEIGAELIVLALPTDCPEELREAADGVRALAICKVIVASLPTARVAAVAVNGALLP